MRRTVLSIICILLLFADAPRCAAAAVPPSLQIRSGEPPKRHEAVDLEPYGTGSDLHELFTTEELHGGPDAPYGDPEGSFFSLQGACSDGTYCYFAFLLKLSSKIKVNDRIACARWEDGRFRLEKLTVFGVEQDIADADGTPLHINERTDVPFELFHANDLTYDRETDRIVVQYDTAHKKVGLIDAACLRPGGTADLGAVREAELSMPIGAVEACPQLNGHLLGVVGASNYFVLADRAFLPTLAFGYPEASEEPFCGRQSICADDRYLYAVRYILKQHKLEDGSAVFELDGQLKTPVDIYELNTGRYLTTIECRSPETAYVVEGESMIAIGGSLFLFFNYMRTKKDWYFCYADLTVLLEARRVLPGGFTIDTLDGETRAAVGDVNIDGRIDAADARLVFRAARKPEELTPLQRRLADVNRDSKVNVTDARAILLYRIPSSGALPRI